MTQPTCSTIILNILPNAPNLLKVERERNERTLFFFFFGKKKEHFSIGAYLTRNTMEARKNKTQKQTQSKKIYSHGGYFHYKSERHKCSKA